jgi:hypothetical protein
MMRFSLKSLLPAPDLGRNRVRSVCAQTACENVLMMKYVSGSNLGIHVGPSWYCSSECFAIASREVLASLSAGSVVEMPRTSRLSLGLALLQKGYLSEEQLRSATAQSRLQAFDLETYLVESGIVSEKQLAGARAVQWGHPVLAQDLIGQIVDGDLPKALLQACFAVPIHYSMRPKRLVLGFVNRVEHSLLQAIEQITGCRAEPCFITATEFRVQSERLRPVAGYEEAVFENPGNAAQMARTLGGFAVGVAATDATIASCKSWIWSRIEGRGGIVDVLFDLRGSAAARTKDSGAVPEVTSALG